MTNESNVSVANSSEDDSAFEKSLSLHPFLAGLSAPHLHLLAGCAMRMHHDRDKILFQEGEPANRFYLIEQGSVVLEATGEDGQTVEVQTLGPGDVVGWSWLVPPHYWQFSARTLEPLTAIFFYGTRLRDACEADPRLGYELLKRVSGVAIKRLQATRRRLLDGVRGGSANLNKNAGGTTLNPIHCGSCENEPSSLPKGSL